MASFPPNKRVGSMVKVDELPTNNNKNNQVQDLVGNRIEDNFSNVDLKGVAIRFFPVKKSSVDAVFHRECHAF